MQKIIDSAENHISIVRCFYRDTVQLIYNDFGAKCEHVRQCSASVLNQMLPMRILMYSFWAFSKNNMKKYDADTKLSLIRNISCYFKNLAVQLQCIIPKIPKQHLLKDRSNFGWFFLIRKCVKTSFLNPLGVVREEQFLI